MPRVSERHKLLRELDMMLHVLMKHDETNSPDFDELLGLKATLSAVRYMNLKKYINRDRRLNHLVFEYGPETFRQQARMVEPSFR